jgi:hypothetical protein
MYLFHYFCRNPKRCTAEPCLRNNGVYICKWLPFFCSCVFPPLFWPFYHPLCTFVSSCHNTQHRHPCPRRNFFIPLYSVRTSYLCLCLDCPVFCLFVFTFNTQNTNTHAPGSTRTRNPSKRSALDSRLRPRGHWDRFCRRVVWSIQIRHISPKVNSVCHIIWR